MKKYVVLYQSADDVATRAREHFPAHQALYEEFQRDGTLLMIGTFGNPQEEGSMAIFTTREAAETFVSRDPFVVNRVVRNPRVLDWNEAIAP